MIDDQRRQRFALNVLGHNQQRACRFHYFVEKGQQILQHADFSIRDQDYRILHHRLHFFWIGDEVR